MVYGTFVDREIIDQETAVLLFNNDFRSLDILQALSAGNLNELRELLKDCPGIQKPGKLMAIKFIIMETKKGLTVCFQMVIRTISYVQSNEFKQNISIDFENFYEWWLSIHYGIH